MNAFSKPRLAIDADGVIANFEALATDIFGMPPKEAEAEFGKKEFWKRIYRYRDPETGYGFYRALPLMPDAMVLWNAVKHLNPTILTGCPLGDWAPPQKVAWARAHFGPDVRIITCMAREKVRYIENPGDVLVDDMTKFQSIWEEGGGVFVHHTDAASTIVKLKELHPEWFV